MYTSIVGPQARSQRVVVTQPPTVQTTQGDSGFRTVHLMVKRTPRRTIPSRPAASGGMKRATRAHQTTTKTASGGSQYPQDRPRRVPVAPRPPQVGPESSKTAPGGSLYLQDRPMWVPTSPRPPQMGPKLSKTAPGGSQHFQDRPRRVPIPPRPPQVGPNSPRTPQAGLNTYRPHHRPC